MTALYSFLLGLSPLDLILIPLFVVSGLLSLLSLVVALAYCRLRFLEENCEEDEEE